MAPWAVALVVGLLELTDEVFLADAEVRRERTPGVLRGACVVRDADTPSYRLTYEDDAGSASFCVWRPWRVGTFLVDEDTPCEC